MELLDDPASPVQSLAWEFSTGPTTGLSGPTGPLADALDKAGIPWTAP